MIPAPSRYVLQSPLTGKIYEDTNWILEAPGEAEPSLLKTIYSKKQLEIREELGFYRFADWLPVHRFLEGSSAPVTYKSEGLSRYLGLENLYVTFSGYWPQRGCMMRTCSFKETEAYSVCARMDPETKDVLVVASAGNTARAFARVCSDNLIPLLLFVPADTIDVLWFDEPIGDCVKLIATPAGSDYYDAIHLSNQACLIDGFFPEGGAKNIARRDGMATTVLSAATYIGRIPDLYVQAVGSGTGAVAAWEAALRLKEDGRFGDHTMKLFLSQNFPFHPMVDAWEARSRKLFPMDDDEARDRVKQIDAKVLSNRRPPYTILGGLFDALMGSNGEIGYYTNEESAEAGRLFLELEGNDLHPAAAVATASLIKGIREKRIGKEQVIMLNITGGGENLFKTGRKLVFLNPSLTLSPEIPLADLEKELRTLFPG